MSESNEHPTNVTRLLNKAIAGDEQAAERVFRVVYDELKRLAAIQRRRLKPSETLPPTAIVNEAYLRLVDRDGAGWNDRHHFFCTAARAMRDILVEDARRKATKKRGGGHRRVTLVESAAELEASPEVVLELNSALKKLEHELPDDAQLVLLRYFVGLNMNEIADVLGTPLRSVERRWRFCRAWLAKEMGEEDADPNS